ncbi:MAG: hypothetical protein BVN28_04930 [Nitrospira sp. ST-bin4]|nr:MAG: hypothetical protein BVN28_04930 [Nitrospira sp. ST-bin4]
MIEQVVRTTMSTGCPDDHIGGTYIKHAHQMVSKTKRRGIVSGADKFEATRKRRRLNRRLVWWSQRDLNPCLKMTTTSPFIFASFDEFVKVRNGYD